MHSEIPSCESSVASRPPSVYPFLVGSTFPGTSSLHNRNLASLRRLPGPNRIHSPAKSSRVRPNAKTGRSAKDVGFRRENAASYLFRSSITSVRKSSYATTKKTLPMRRNRGGYDGCHLQVTWAASARKSARTAQTPLAEGDALLHQVDSSSLTPVTFRPSNIFSCAFFAAAPPCNRDVSARSSRYRRWTGTPSTSRTTRSSSGRTRGACCARAPGTR